MINIVEAIPTAVIRMRVAQSELSRVVPALCGEVWEFFPKNQLPKPGRLVACYLDCEMNIEVGVEVTEPIIGDGRVVPSHLPAGKVVTAVHVGPYSRLRETHQAIQNRVVQDGLTMDGRSWEIYGHWKEDESQLRTDVSYLLK